MLKPKTAVILILTAYVLVISLAISFIISQIKYYEAKDQLNSKKSQFIQQSQKLIKCEEDKKLSNDVNVSLSAISGELNQILTGIDTNYGNYYELVGSVCLINDTDKKYYNLRYDDIYKEYQGFIERYKTILSSLNAK